MLATARLRLRRFVHADIPRVAEICSDWRVASMCRVVPFPYSEEHATFFVDEISATPGSLVLAIETQSDARLVGCISLEDFRPGDGGGTVANLGYWLAAEAWGHGFATEAALALIDYAFKARGIAAIESGYWTENAASARVQEKLGFTIVRHSHSRCAARACELQQAHTHLAASLWQAKKAIQRPPPVVVRQLLSEEQLSEIEQYVSQLHADEDCGWVRYGDAHEAHFLHHGGVMHDDVSRTLAEACPRLFEGLIARVRQEADESALCSNDSFDKLSIRCVEHHKYSAGGGLTDKGHCDAGSTITLSALLSDHCEGGRFSTTDERGVVTVHDLRRGDGLLFCSEMVHNVSKLKSGVRCSLVIEWWARRPNRRDRFS